MQNFDVTIVGGGVTGLMTAFFCERAGYKVLLLEQGQLGQQSSWAGGGILAPLHHWQYDTELLKLAQFGFDFFPEFFQILEQSTGIDPEYINSGMWVGHDEPIQACPTLSLFHSTQFESNNEMPSDLVHYQCDSQYLSFFKNIGQVRPPRLIRALQHYLSDKITIREFSTVVKIDTAGEQVTGVQTRTEKIVCPNVIVCTGAWAAKLLSSFSSQPDVRPIRGQMIAYNLSKPVINQLLLVGGKYFIPRSDGLLLVGSSVEDVGYDNTLTNEVRDELILFSQQCFQCLKNTSPVEHWSGLRPGSAGGVPYVGRHPEISGLWVNAGQFRNGITLAPGSADLIVDQLMGRPIDVATTKTFEWDSVRQGSWV